MASFPTVNGTLVNQYTFGRPSKLTEELLDKAREYVGKQDNMSAATLLPTRERLCLVLGITRDTLVRWEKENDDFSDICKNLDILQAEKLIQNGLVGRYTPAITAIMLSKHGHVKTEQVDNKHEMVNPILGGASVHSDDQHPQVTEAE